MSVVSPQHPNRVARLLPLVFCGLLMGCSTPAGTPPVSGGAPSYEYFGRPAPTDPWTPKIVGWQLRERAQPAIDELATAPAVSKGRKVKVPVSGQSLRDRYFAYRSERKRELARDLAEWMQAMAKRHYVPDGLVDHWATLEETLERNGDDCDGLELLAFHFLLDHGFPESEVYRAVIYRPRDGQHHMVTLWFEDPNDPWVLDPTGAMTSGMPKMSDRPDWVPLKLFTESDQFTVRKPGQPEGTSSFSWSATRR